ncbi:MAG: aminoacyl-tRNA hydrolase [Acetilactobacillus jinshanensis]
MKLIVGLGNVGMRFENTRHNTGFMVVNSFADQHHIILSKVKMNARFGSGMVNGEKVICAEPTTDMNLSGGAVQPLMHFFKLSIKDMIVAYDDMDLPVGKIRIRDHGSAGGHNGIKSIIHCIGTNRFNRIRVGTAHPKHMAVDDYVLSPFTAQQKPKFEKAKGQAVDALNDWVAGTKVRRLMNKYN